MDIYQDRHHAAERLIQELPNLNPRNTIVAAIPRGGVEIGALIAHKVGCPLALSLVKKISHPSFPEYAIGAITADGQTMYQEGPESFSENTRQTQESIAKQKLQPFLPFSITARADLANKTVVLVDDGVATGMTVWLAAQQLKKHGVKKVIIAVPVIPGTTADEFRRAGYEIVSPLEVAHFAGGVGSYYQSFEQVSTATVLQILQQRSIASSADAQPHSATKQSPPD
jgi:putative phosphoribosyl transferase